MKVTITGESLKSLAIISKQTGTTERWMDIALEWIEQADKEINRLIELLDKERR